MHRRAISSGPLALTLTLSGPALAQDTPERVITFGHLNNTDHPVSLGVDRFAELLPAQSGVICGLGPVGYRLGPVGHLLAVRALADALALAGA